MISEILKDKKQLEKMIINLKKSNPAADIQLLEKTLGALHLVECLAHSGLDFVFKGGTSLVLLLSDLKRFSVDVDIITEENKGRVREILEQIIKNQDLFIRLEENVRNNASSKRMDLQHFKFFFNSVTDDSEKYILLDIAYEKNQYSKIIEKKIESSKLGITSDVIVKLPSVESILGDKLTVLATETTGIRYDSGKELELMKQLYDVDKLFNQAKDVSAIRDSFISISNREIQYRNLVGKTYKDVIIDIRELCEDIILLKNKQHFKAVCSGTSKLAGYIMERKFLPDREALIAASKVWYLLSILDDEENNNIERYSEGIVRIGVNVPDKYKKRLKNMEKFNREAWWYVMKSFGLDD